MSMKHLGQEATATTFYVEHNPESQKLWCSAMKVVYGFNPVARWRYRKLPGPRPQWLFGNLREVIKKGNHQAYTDWQRSYGSVFRVRFQAFVEKPLCCLYSLKQCVLWHKQGRCRG